MANGPIAQSRSGPYQVDSRLTRGVVSRRFWAYLVDMVVICDLVRHRLPWAIFGLGRLHLWSRLGSAALVPLTAIIYNAMTIGGSSQATVGMRFAGLRVVDANNGGPAVRARRRRPRAAVLCGGLDLHPLGLRYPLGLFRDDGRFGHDFSPAVVFRPDSGQLSFACSTVYSLTFTSSATGRNRCTNVIRWAFDLRLKVLHRRQWRDESAARRTAILPHFAVALPLSAGQGRAESFHAHHRTARP